MKGKQESKPLTTAALQILLALSEGDLHGYGIMQSIKRQSGGTYKLGPGTLYANLSILFEKEWVGETQRKIDEGTRREYFLTDEGQRALRADVQRLKQLVAAASRRLAKLSEKEI